jgi:hypothetical protein
MAAAKWPDRQELRGEASRWPSRRDRAGLDAHCASGNARFGERRARCLADEHDCRDQASVRDKPSDLRKLLPR